MQFNGCRGDNLRTGFQSQRFAIPIADHTTCLLHDWNKGEIVNDCQPEAGSIDLVSGM